MMTYITILIAVIILKCIEISNHYVGNMCAQSVMSNSVIP